MNIHPDWSKCISISTSHVVFLCTHFDPLSTFHHVSYLSPFLLHQTHGTNISHLSAWHWQVLPFSPYSSVVLPASPEPAQPFKLKVLSVYAPWGRYTPTKIIGAWSKCMEHHWFSIKKKTELTLYEMNTKQCNHSKPKKVSHLETSSHLEYTILSQNPV